MENLVLLAHLIIALVIIGLILLQQGKGAEVGASFGAGASQTLFGATGSGNFFAKMTALFAAAFFATSFGLAVIAKKQSSIDDGAIIPALDASVPAEESAPAMVEDDGMPQISVDVGAEDEELPSAPVETTTPE
jgi:preprotein translocase subunit SecG